jgi:signal transduction histidine kinase
MTKFFSSLRVRLVLFVILAALPALVLTIYSGNEQRKHATNDVQRDILTLAELATINQETFVENTRIFLIALSHNPAVSSPDVAECRELLSHLVSEHYAQFTSFYVADLETNVVCSAPNSHVTDNLAECEHYAEMVATGEFVVSNYHLCKATGKAIMAMGYPVHDADGNFIRVINISIDLSWLNEVAAQADLPPGSTLDVFDHAGHYLTHYPDPEKYIGKVLPDDSPLNPLLRLEEGTLVAKAEDGVERIYATTPMESAQGSVKVILGVPTAVAFAEVNRTTARNLVLLGTATLLAALAAALLAELLIMRRTRALLQTTQQLASGDLSARTTIPHDQGELGQLASSFDQMADSLEQRAKERDQAEASMREYAAELERSNRELQDFANVASHDMQEPLRKILTFSELLQTRYAPDLDERGQDYLQRMDKAATRLHNLINDLLAYSRVTTRAQPFVKVDLNDVARRVLSDLDLHIEETHAQVELTPLPSLEADPTQMYQLLQNLVSNAIKYHLPDQPPHIRITAPPTASGEENGMRQFQVSDWGVGFDEKYLDRIFQPFQRLHRSTEFEGTGMGLAICRKIVERHGGSISARSAPGQGATFTIRLPARQNSGGTPP